MRCFKRYSNPKCNLVDIMPSIATNRETESFNDMIARIFPEKSSNGKHKKTMSVTFQVTDTCNLCCTYCYQINKGQRRMKLETAKKLVDYLLDATPENNSYLNPDIHNAIILDFIGGEPLLEIELIDQIVDYFIAESINKNHPWKERYIISIGTNGVLYFDPKVQEFLDKHSSHMSINITVDGNKRLHDACRIFPDGSGSYDMASSAVSDWMTRSSSTNSKLTIAPENVEYLYEAVKSMFEFGYNAIQANCVFEEGWTISHAKIYYQQLKMIADYMIDNNLVESNIFRIFNLSWFAPVPPEENSNWCGGDGSMLAMDPDGYLYNCVRYMESALGDSQKGLTIGHIDRGIGCTDLDRNNVQCMKCITRKSQSTTECFECPIGGGCSWCSAYNYQCHGTPDKRSTFICEMHKAEALANSYYWNNYLEKKYNDTKDIRYYYNRFHMNIPYDWVMDIIDDDEYQILIKLARQNKGRSMYDC